MAFYTEYEPTQVRLYNNLVRRSRKLSKVLFASHKGYRWMRRFFKHTFPYCTVNEGDTVIQVGSASSLLLSGVSQPIIYSVLVGPRGNVFVVEPDSANVNALIDYINEYDLDNISVIYKGAWDRRGVERFTYYIGHPGTNVQSDHAPIREQQLSNRRKRVIVEERETEVDTLDNMIDEYRIGRVNHINITVNGTEFTVINGLTRNLDRVDSLSFVYSNPQTVETPLLEHLESKGFDIVIKHAPVFMKQKQFLVGVATKSREGVIGNMFKHSHEARFEYSLDKKTVSVIPSS